MGLGRSSLPGKKGEFPRYAEKKIVRAGDRYLNETTTSAAASPKKKIGPGGGKKKSKQQQGRGGALEKKEKNWLQGVAENWTICDQQAKGNEAGNPAGRSGGPAHRQS